MRVALPALLFVSLLAASCADKPLESLNGCFATDAQGEVSLKIGQVDEQFGISLREDKAWSDVQPLRVIERAELDQLLTTDVVDPDEPAVLAGLQTEDRTLAVYYLGEQVLVKGKRLDSRYLGRFYFGSGTIYRKDCPDA